MLMRGQPRTAAIAAVACCLIVLASALIAACGQTSPSPSPRPSPPGGAEGVVMRVDGEPLTQGDVDDVQAELRLAGAGDDAQAARAQAMRRLLVRREAQRLGVTVRQRDVDARVRDIAGSLGGEEALKAALERADMSAAQLASAARYSLLERAVADRMFRAEKPTSAAVAGFYHEQRDELFTHPAKTRLRQITLPSEAMAMRVAGEIEEGLAFAAAARRYSMDQQTRYEGGMVGWVFVASLPAEVATAIALVPPGELAGPVRSAGRWHLYQVLARRAAAVVPFAEVREDIEAELTRRLRAAALNDWVGDELRQATVESSP